MKYEKTDHLAAARRLYKMGKYDEAIDKLDQLDAESQRHQDALELRWALHADQGHWARCVDIARILTLRYPDDPHGWICLADSIRNVPGGTLHMSYEVLFSATRRHCDPILLLTLARYSAQLGKTEEMHEWITKAQKAGSPLALNHDVRIQ